MYCYNINMHLNEKTNKKVLFIGNLLVYDECIMSFLIAFYLIYPFTPLASFNFTAKISSSLCDNLLSGAMTKSVSNYLGNCKSAYQSKFHSHFYLFFI